MILYLAPIRDMTNNSIVKNLEMIMDTINNTIEMCKETHIDTNVSNESDIKTMVLFRSWHPCEDAFESHIDEEMIAFFPSEEKAREIANRWVETQKQKHSGWKRFTAFVIPLSKKLNGKRITKSGFESDFEVGDHF